MVPSAPHQAVQECKSMFVIIGIGVVFGAVVDGHLMEHGIRVLLQPAELLIIRGRSGDGAVANPSRAEVLAAAG
jgi:flagellar motor component MotA